eukprot:TRINITY_DN21607_c0_g1_i1.p1 TRINITY_DN21607_c0_g1~~TRINITY_DN21607_c0_g1_i1.p1  ORF type:complete len:239 (+),score=37.95 TRINITY_DN21607_c0_g1_i1:54-770(+)
MFERVLEHIAHDVPQWVSEAASVVRHMSCFERYIGAHPWAHAAAGEQAAASVPCALGEEKNPLEDVIAALGQGSESSCGSPASWGPKVWKSLHCAVHQFPETLSSQQRQHFTEIMNSLPRKLPCKSCGEHLQRLLQDNPVDTNLKSRDEAERWLIGLHNKVNADLGKDVMGESDARHMVQNMCDGKAGSSPHAFSQLSVAQASLDDAWVLTLAQGSWHGDKVNPRHSQRSLSELRCFL